MGIKTKFNIGQTVYLALFGERVDERQIEAITITEGYVEYKLYGGATAREEQLSETYEEAIDILMQYEERMHRTMIEYFQKKKGDKK